MFHDENSEAISVSVHGDFLMNQKKSGNNENLEQRLKIPFTTITYSTIPLKSVPGPEIFVNTEIQPYIFYT